MSDDYHRPTYTTTDVHGAFNATQVRLYGIPGLPKQQKKEKPPLDPITGVLGNYAIFLTKIKAEGESHEIIPVIEGLLRGKGNESTYVFIESVMRNYMILLGAIDIDSPESSLNPLSSGIIFGYAYEGHTYDLPKPKVMLIPALPEETIPHDDSNYKRKEDEGYAVWIVDKLDKCVEIEVNQGFVEQLVLEANLPGKRAPTMYAARMMMGHRSGRLTE